MNRDASDYPDCTNIALLVLIDLRMQVEDADMAAEVRLRLNRAIQSLFEIIHEHGVSTARLEPHWQILSEYREAIPAVPKLGYILTFSSTRVKL